MKKYKKKLSKMTALQFVSADSLSEGVAVDAIVRAEYVFNMTDMQVLDCVTTDVLRHLDSPDIRTKAELIDALQTYENNGKLVDTYSSSAQPQRGERRGFGRKPFCYNCMEYGHKSFNCPKCKGKRNTGPLNVASNVVNRATKDLTAQISSLVRKQKHLPNKPK